MGTESLYDDVRPGKPRTTDNERVAQLIKTTLHTKPANCSTHWSVRTVAAETGISKTSRHRDHSTAIPLLARNGDDFGAEQPAVLRTWSEADVPPMNCGITPILGRAWLCSIDRLL